MLSYYVSLPSDFHVVVSVTISAWNDVGFVFTSSCLWERSCFIYVICVCVRIVVSNTYCVVFLFCLSLSCVSYVASLFGLDCPFMITSSVFAKKSLKIPKGVIRIRILKKNRQNNGRKKKYKWSNSDVQNVYSYILFIFYALRSYLDMSHNQNYWYMDFCHTFYIYKLDNFHHWNSIYHIAVIFLEVSWMEDDYKTCNIWRWVCLHFLPERRGELWKESLNSDGQQFHLYKQNEPSLLTSTR